MELKKLLKHKEPTGYEYCFRGLIRKHCTLENGWQVIILKNNMAVIYRCTQEMCFGAVKKVCEAKNGMFMIVKKNGLRAIFDCEGKCLSDFNKTNMLFENGWYVMRTDKSLSLFNAEGENVCSKVKNAFVFKNGRYYVAFENEGEQKGGLFEPDGTRILFTGQKGIKMFRNGWFIAEGDLYDNRGDYFTGVSEGIKFNPLFLTCLCFIMPKKH